MPGQSDQAGKACVAVSAAILTSVHLLHLCAGGKESLGICGAAELGGGGRGGGGGSTMSQRRWYRCAMRSQCSCGDMPALSADAAIFSPCSSVPVTNVTDLPCSRWNRAATSAAMVEYAPPMCGSAWHSAGDGAKQTRHRLPRIVREAAGVTEGRHDGTACHRNRGPAPGAAAMGSRRPE